MYREQLERTRRAYARLEELDRGRPHDRNSEFYKDELYAFFQNCHHLKDWLKNDRSQKFPSRAVEDFISANRELRLCADLCNGSKHLQLRDPRSGEDPRVGSVHVNLILGGAPDIAIKYTIETSNGPVDAYKLAGRCLELWTNFIKTQGGAA